MTASAFGSVSVSDLQIEFETDSLFEFASDWLSASDLPIAFEFDSPFEFESGLQYESRSDLRIEFGSASSSGPGLENLMETLTVFSIELKFELENETGT